MFLISQNQEFTDSIQLTSGERFLKFPLNSEVNSLLSLLDLQGTINVRLKELLPVPHVAESWLGVMNWRGEAIWILDLASFLGGTHWFRQENVASQGMAILIKAKTQTIGLLVKQVNGIEYHEREKLLPMMELMILKEQQEFFQGYFLDSEGKPVMLLDVPNLITALSYNRKQLSVEANGRSPVQQ